MSGGFPENDFERSLDVLAFEDVEEVIGYNVRWNSDRLMGKKVEFEMPMLFVPMTAQN